MEGGFHPKFNKSSYINFDFCWDFLFILIEFKYLMILIRKLELYENK